MLYILICREWCFGGRRSRSGEPRSLRRRAGGCASVDQHASEIRDALTCAGRKITPAALLSYAQGLWRPRSRGVGGRRTGRSAIRGTTSRSWIGSRCAWPQSAGCSSKPGPRHHRLRSLSTAILMILDRCMRCCDPSNPSPVMFLPGPCGGCGREPPMAYGGPAATTIRPWRRLGRWIIYDKTCAFPTTGPAPPGRLTKCGCRVRYATERRQVPAGSVVTARTPGRQVGVLTTNGCG